MFTAAEYKLTGEEHTGMNLASTAILGYMGIKNKATKNITKEQVEGLLKYFGGDQIAHLLGTIDNWYTVQDNPKTATAYLEFATSFAEQIKSGKVLNKEQLLKQITQLGDKYGFSVETLSGRDQFAIFINRLSPELASIYGSCVYNEQPDVKVLKKFLSSVELNVDRNTIMRNQPNSLLERVKAIATDNENGIYNGIEWSDSQRNMINSIRMDLKNLCAEFMKSGKDGKSFYQVLRDYVERRLISNGALEEEAKQVANLICEDLNIKSSSTSVGDVVHFLNDDIDSKTFARKLALCFLVIAGATSANASENVNADGLPWEDGYYRGGAVTVLPEVLVVGEKDPLAGIISKYNIPDDVASYMRSQRDGLSNAYDSATEDVSAFLTRADIIGLPMSEIEQMDEYKALLAKQKQAEERLDSYPQLYATIYAGGGTVKLGDGASGSQNVTFDFSNSSYVQASDCLDALDDIPMDEWTTDDFEKYHEAVDTQHNEAENYAHTVFEAFKDAVKEAKEAAAKWKEQGEVDVNLA